MKILLADDEPIARTMLEHWLAGWGYEVTLARDGESALQALKDDPELRLLVVDWVMPKKDGIEVCKAIRSGPQEPYVYIVLLTAKDDKSDIIAGLDAGADDYLVKPCNPLELKVRLRAGRRVIELQEQLVKARESLRFEAMHDSLTGLLNRGAVLEQLTKELVRASRRGAPVSVLMGDLDHFKTINDTFGHVAGDAVLRETARRLKAGVRAYDSLGRLGGEEFIAVFAGVRRQDGPQRRPATLPLACGFADSVRWQRHRPQHQHRHRRHRSIRQRASRRADPRRRRRSLPRQTPPAARAHCSRSRKSSSRSKKCRKLCRLLFLRNRRRSFGVGPGSVQACAAQLGGGTGLPGNLNIAAERPRILRCGWWSGGSVLAGSAVAGWAPRRETRAFLARAPRLSRWCATS